jgi:hypothetical protein
MDVPIRNISDLREEILRLKGAEREQGIAIGLRFKNFSSTISTLGSLFPKVVSADGKSTSFFDQDLVGLISRFVLPFTLNKTIFRNSNFIIKTIVGIASQKASHFISEESVMGAWDMIKSLFDKKAKKAKNPELNTIPPLSETY